MLAERGESVVQVARQIEQRFGVVRQALLLPSVGHGFKHGPQRDGRGERHFAREGVVHQRGVGFEGGLQQRLVGNERHDEIRSRLERLPIRLVTQHAHMFAQRFGMGFEQFAAACQLVCAGTVGNLASALIVGIRHLRVDGDGFAAGQMHHHVGALVAAVGIFDHHLRVEIDMFEQPGRFNDIAQLRLAPRAAHLVIAQRGGQRVRLLVEPRLLFTQALELFAERAHFLLAPLLDLRDLGLQGVQVLLHRGQRFDDAALLLQALGLFGALGFLLGGGAVAFVLNANLLGLLRLGEL